MGKPQITSGWIEEKDNGISVYYRPGLNAEDVITISAGGAWIFKALSVRGIRV